MFIKIYFDESPLFLADSLDGELAGIARDNQLVPINYSSAATLMDVIDAMETPGTRGRIVLHSSLTALQKAFWAETTVLKAGGGLVMNKASEWLMIFRRGKWDLPKGKLEDGETIEDCALREVTEETGVQDIMLKDYIMTTYHTYRQQGDLVVKESHWYNMEIADRQALIPQAEEDIAEARWVKKADLPLLMENSFPSIRDVLKKAAGEGASLQ